MHVGEDVAPKLLVGRGVNASCGDNDNVGSEPETGDDEEVWTDLVKKVDELFSSPENFAALSDAVARDCPPSAQGEVRSAWRSAMATRSADGGGGRISNVHPREGTESLREGRAGIQARDGPAMRRPPLVRKPSSSPSPPLNSVPSGPRGGEFARQNSQAPSLPSVPLTPRCPREATRNMMPSYTPPFRADIVGGISSNVSPSPLHLGPQQVDDRILPTLAGAGKDIEQLADQGGFACTKQSFRVARLGVPSPPSWSGASRQAPECAPEPRDQSTSMSYIHIPRHSLQDFQSFARSVAAEARRETATDNPYVQALRKHRAELQTYSVIPNPMEEPSLAQQMGTEREALSLITPVTRSARLGASVRAGDASRFSV